MSSSVLADDATSAYPRRQPRCHLVSRNRAKSQAERLEDALKTTGVSRRQLAIALLGGDTTRAKVDSKKTQILRWLKGTHGMSDDTARKVAAAFTSLGHPHTERAFFADPVAPRSWREEMAEIRASQDKILEELRKLSEAR
jgi:hypothetical protein